jgi:hypothetical protein
MKKGIFQKRIPTLLALFILLSGLVVSSYLIQQGILTIGQATPNEEPQNVQITNITEDSFTIAFTTLEPTVSGVSVVNSDPPSVFFDTRDPQGNKPYTSHLITVTKLKPETKYEFNILSNGTIYLNNGENFTTKTSLKGDLTPNPNSLSGKVLLPDGLDGADVLINAIIPNAAPATAVTNSKGEYTVPSTLIRNRSHDTLLSLEVGTEIVLNAQNGRFSSEIKFIYIPGVEIPTITLSNNYSFIADVQEVEVSTPSSELEIPTGSKPSEVKISTPKEDQTFTDVKPQFQGTAFPNKIVKINVGPNNEVSTQVRSGPNGNWSYRPAVSLSTGQHSINVNSPDSLGIARSATRSFSILPSGSQIAESATPSATPTTQLPTSTPTFTLAPTSTPDPTGTTPSPGITNTPTLIPTSAPTVTPLESSPTPTVFVPPQKQIPPTGPETLPIILTSISLLFIVAGSALLFIL